MKKLIILRRCSQFLFLFIFVYILWAMTYPLKGIFPPDAFFRFDPLINIVTSISQRVILPGLLFSMAAILLTLILGRFFCGWVCPLGTMIDISGVKSKNLPVTFPLFGKGKGEANCLKYYILSIIVILSFIGIQIAWVFDPIVITARFVSLNFIPFVTLSIDKIFVFIIKNAHLYGAFYDFYRSLKSSFLGINLYYFPHTLRVLIFFLIICNLALITKRFWCRIVCPLGAVYAIISKFSFLSRKVYKCTNCLKCKPECRMQAIKADLSYEKSECILCMDCIYECPAHATKFDFRFPLTLTLSPKGRGDLEGIDRQSSISRKDFLFLMGASVFLLGFNWKDRIKKNILRPPGVLEEGRFLNSCIRCGNCMRVCPTNVLQPVIFESGITGIWSPKLVPEIGYCEYNCNLCGTVCPTNAIPKLSLPDKHKAKIGTACIDHSTCIAWAFEKECIVCEEHCPVPQKAIKLERVLVNGITIPKPYVDASLCIGCGACQNKCPVRPVRAIKVSAA